MSKKVLQEEYFNEIPIENIRIYEEDIISIKNQSKELPFKIDEGWEDIVTDFIKDKEKTEGRQTWIVKVIGHTQHFIHVLDKSRRSWVDTNGFKQRINQNDYLEIAVVIEHKGSQIKAQKITKLNPVE